MCFSAFCRFQPNTFIKTCVTYTIRLTGSFQQMTKNVGARSSSLRVLFPVVGLGMVIGSKTCGIIFERFNLEQPNGFGQRFPNCLTTDGNRPSTSVASLPYLRQKAHENVSFKTAIGKSEIEWFFAVK